MQAKFAMVNECFTIFATKCNLEVAIFYMLLLYNYTELVGSQKCKYWARFFKVCNLGTLH